MIARIDPSTLHRLRVRWGQLQVKLADELATVQRLNGDLHVSVRYDILEDESPLLYLVYAPNWSKPSATKSVAVDGLAALFSLHELERLTSLLTLLRDVMKLLDDIRIAGAGYWREVLGDR